MFEFLFSHPAAAFQKGEFVLLGPAPWWMLALSILAAAAGLGWLIWRRRSALAAGLKGWRPAAIWALQATLAALLLLLLWQPALQLSALKPQQNVIAVVVDDSRSMSIVDGGETRSAGAVTALEGGLLGSLSESFQVRLYRLGDRLERINGLDQLTADRQATRIGEGLREVVAEAGSVPIGAVLLMSDGADNSGGLDLKTLAEVRSRRIPVHTVGFGRERFEKDVEISAVELPDRSLADSRVAARVTFRQRGYAGSKARLTVRDGGRVLVSKDIELDSDGGQQTESLLFNAGSAGAKHLLVSIDPLEGEENPRNNTLSRLINVESAKPRVLYLEGEPRWEYKFIRRAMQKDRTVQLTSILRTTQNKIYRQGVASPDELKDGFPSDLKELFAYEGLILGSVEAGYLTPSQQQAVMEFVDRRGGGVLFLGGRAALADGGYKASLLAEILPVTLPEGKATFRRDRVGVRLAAGGRDSLITRLVENPEANEKRWSDLPQLADYEEAGSPKPGAMVLAELMSPNGRPMPLLVTQNFGHGRTAVFATGGSWRWQMQQDLADQTHEVFWQQLLRWLVTGTPGQVLSSTPRQVLADESRVPLAVRVRDKNFMPVLDARVEAKIMGPAGASGVAELSPDPKEPGIYIGEWQAGNAGGFVAEVVARRGEEEIGRDVLNFRREDGVAENFRAEQNRELLGNLASQTGGRYWKPDELARLPKEITYSEAGITVRETRDLWNMPAVFLALILLKAAEWFLRRRWGVV
ncbi:MAG: hypothetical protein KIT09_07275 [Bryobacteraceae bacterium]|nr:hypothetical protein [Bryobacteraceae bacterium]